MTGVNLSAQKRTRQNIKRRERNKALKNEIKTYYKKFLKAVEDKNKNEALELLTKNISLLDKAIKKNVLHSNNADRKKSVIMKLFNSMDSKKKENIKNNA